MNNGIQCSFQMHMKFTLINQSFIIKIYHKWKVDHRIELPMPYEGVLCLLEIMHQCISMWQ